MGMLSAEDVESAVYDKTQELRARVAELEEALTWARVYVKDAWFRCGDNDQGEDATLNKIDALLFPESDELERKQ